MKTNPDRQKYRQFLIKTSLYLALPIGLQFFCSNSWTQPSVGSQQPTISRLYGPQIVGSPNSSCTTLLQKPPLPRYPVSLFGWPLSPGYHYSALLLDSLNLPGASLPQLKTTMGLFIFDPEYALYPLMWRWQNPTSGQGNTLLSQKPPIGVDLNSLPIKYNSLINLLITVAPRSIPISLLNIFRFSSKKLLKKTSVGTVLIHLAQENPEVASALEFEILLVNEILVHLNLVDQNLNPERDSPKIGTKLLHSIFAALWDIYFYGARLHAQSLPSEKSKLIPDSHLHYFLIQNSWQPVSPDQSLVDIKFAYLFLKLWKQEFPELLSQNNLSDQINEELRETISALESSSHSQGEPSKIEKVNKITCMAKFSRYLALSTTALQLLETKMINIVCDENPLINPMGENLNEIELLSFLLNMLTT
ncbi:MAG: hypothetical protein K1X29_00115 [Bdellovibrionales bacterium]|nr:hypothetical protein [Bdellovibrionales bacterium]